MKSHEKPGPEVWLTLLILFWINYRNRKHAALLYLSDWVSLVQQDLGAVQGKHWIAMISSHSEDMGQMVWQMRFCMFLSHQGSLCFSDSVRPWKRNGAGSDALSVTEELEHTGLLSAIWFSYFLHSRIHHNSSSDAFTHVHSDPVLQEPEIHWVKESLWQHQCHGCILLGHLVKIQPRAAFAYIIMMNNVV